jgi:hypothetical protein
MVVLVDTSIWIDFFRGGNSSSNKPAPDAGKLGRARRVSGKVFESWCKRGGYP